MKVNVKFGSNIQNKINNPKTFKFSSNPNVRRIQELLPDLRTAPINVKNSALLLAEYFRPIKIEKTFGIGMDPGKWPFIFMKDDETFPNFDVALTSKMGKVIKNLCLVLVNLILILLMGLWVKMHLL